MKTREFSGNNIRGVFPSVKMNGPVHFQSLIERDYIYLLEFDTQVTFYETRPFELQLAIGGRWSVYIPDFHVIRDGTNKIVDCRPARRATTVMNDVKRRLVEEWCQENGYQFELVTDEIIREGYLLENIRYLDYFAHYEISETIKGEIKKSLSRSNSARIVDVLISVCPENPQSIIIPILHMARHHEVEITMDQSPISNSSLVRMPTS